ncbi:MAG: GGDEF domain-containing protein [Burkholderiaceae bacterium]|nr:GGDEF domain-containing protein [Burkholderiaceae bacterium]
MTLHLPTLLVAAIATMMMSSALMTLFGRTQRIYRGFWWWTAAQWMGTAGLALQLLRNAQPELLPLSNLLLMQWPIVTLIGVRRFYPRQVLPVPPLADVLLLAFAYLLWAATWAAGGDVAARVAAFGTGACVLFAYSAAITALLHARHRSPALKALIAVQGVTALVQALRVAQAGLAEVPWFARDDVTLIVGLSSAMLAMAMVYLSLLLTHERTTLKLAESQRRLRTLAYTDMLTEVPNRRHFYELATKALALRKPGTAAVVTFDIDHFKQINDSLGHAEGDEALREVARCTRDTLRAQDVAGRIGGDEFAMLLPQTDVEEALSVVDRLSARIEGQRTTGSGNAIALSLSFGIVLARKGENVADALRRADQALYEAKRQGRSRAVVADGSAASPVFGESRAMGLGAR